MSPGLTSLTLTADIPLSSYTAHLANPFTIPPLPPTITSLTLELFSLGLPTPFLTTLASRLPSLASITIYNTLLATSPASARDALFLFRHLTHLQEIHFLDVFSSPGLFKAIADNWATRDPGHGVKFLEVSYTGRLDAEFLSRIDAEDMVYLIGPDIRGLTLSISAGVSLEEDGNGVGENELKLVSGTPAREVAQRVAEAGELVMLDLTMFSLDFGAEVDAILDANRGLKVLALAGIVGEWEDVLDRFAETERGIEVLEIVSVGEEKIGSLDLLGKRMLGGIGEKWKALRSVKVSVLKKDPEIWARESENGEWKKQA